MPTCPYFTPPPFKRTDSVDADITYALYTGPGATVSVYAAPLSAGPTHANRVRAVSGNTPGINAGTFDTVIGVALARHAYTAWSYPINAISGVGYPINAKSNVGFTLN